ncbi:MAG: hypothetical protein ACJ74Y_13165, partial [Bryobacteraceae bacterium]
MKLRRSGILGRYSERAFFNKFLKGTCPAIGHGKAGPDSKRLTADLSGKLFRVANVLTEFEQLLEHVYLMPASLAFAREASDREGTDNGA